MKKNPFYYLLLMMGCLLTTLATQAQLPVGISYQTGPFWLKPLWSGNGKHPELLTGVQRSGYLKVDLVLFLIRLGVNYYKPYQGKAYCQATHLPDGCKSPTLALLDRQPIIGFPLIFASRTGLLDHLSVETGFQPHIRKPNMSTKQFLKGGYREVFRHTEWGYVLGLNMETLLLGLNVRYIIFPQPGKLTLEPSRWRAHMFQASLRVGL